MASLRGHLLNTVIRYAGKRRLAGLEFTPAMIAATRARMERMGDRGELAPPLTRHVDDLGGVRPNGRARNRPLARRHSVLPRRRLRRRFAARVSPPRRDASPH